MIPASGNNSNYYKFSPSGYLDIFICVGVTFIKCGKAKSFKFGHQSRFMTFVDNNLECYSNFL